MSTVNEGQSHTEERKKIWRDFRFWCLKFVLICVFIFAVASAGIEIWYGWQSAKLDAEQEVLWEEIYRQEGFLRKN